MGSCADTVDIVGRLVRVGPKQVLTDDPDAIRSLSSLRSTYFKAPWYKPLATLVRGADNVASIVGNENRAKQYSERILLAPVV